MKKRIQNLQTFDICHIFNSATFKSIHFLHRDRGIHNDLYDLHADWLLLSHFFSRRTPDHMNLRALFHLKVHLHWKTFHHEKCHRQAPLVDLIPNALTKNILITRRPRKQAPLGSYRRRFKGTTLCSNIADINASYLARAHLCHTHARIS